MHVFRDMLINAPLGNMILVLLATPHDGYPVVSIESVWDQGLLTALTNRSTIFTLFFFLIASPSLLLPPNDSNPPLKRLKVPLITFGHPLAE